MFVIDTYNYKDTIEYKQSIKRKQSKSMGEFPLHLSPAHTYKLKGCRLCLCWKLIATSILHHSITHSTHPWFTTHANVRHWHNRIEAINKAKAKWIPGGEEFHYIWARPTLIVGCKLHLCWNLIATYILYYSITHIHPSLITHTYSWLTHQSLILNGSMAA